MICAWIYVRSGFGTWRMSGEIPFGSRSRVGMATAIGSSSARASAARALCTIEEAQQLHVHRTQNAGQPVSGDDSLTPMAQVSATNSELKPLASATRRASTAMSNARRIPIDGIPAADRPFRKGCGGLEELVGIELELAVLLVFAVIGQSTFARFEIFVYE